MNKTCPECEKQLLKPNKCSMCGWVKETKKAVEPVSHQCSWAANNRQCPLPGTHTNSISGAKFWYCSFHNASKNTLQGLDVLDDIERHGIPKRVKRPTDTYIEAIIQSNNLVKFPGEAKTDFINRCKKLFNTSLERLNKKNEPNEPVESRLSENAYDAYIEHVSKLEADGKSPSEAIRIAKEHLVQ